jgi:hypothetical protein
MGGKFISGPAATLVLLLFFLPWVTVSCSGVPVGEFSGYDLALGGGELEGEPLFWLIPLAAVVTLGLLFMARRNSDLAGKAGWGQATAAVVALLVLLTKWLQVRNEAEGVFEILIEPALWGTLLGLLAVVVGAALEIARSRQQPFGGLGPPGGARPIARPRNLSAPPDRPPPGAVIIADMEPRDVVWVPPTASLADAPGVPAADLSDNGGLAMPGAAVPPQPDQGLKKDFPSENGPDAPPRRLSAKTEVLPSEPELLAWLVVRQGEQTGKQFRLGESTLIGRDPDNDIVIEDTAISGKHARVQVEDGRFFIYDHGSTNGVLIYRPDSDRWQKVERYELKDGTQIKLGRTVLHLMTLAVNQA